MLSYDYCCITDDTQEYNDSKCLCGAESCKSLYFSLAADHYDAIMKSSHTTRNRFAMLARACEHYAVKSYVLSRRDAIGLASVGFGEKLFSNSPVWLKCYCAQVIEFIKHERTVLPQHLRSKDRSTEADGVYGLRLQNLAITVDRVLSFLYKLPDQTVPPLYPHTDEEVAQKLVFGNSSIWSKFKDFVAARKRLLLKTGLQGTLESIFKRCEKKRPLIEAARDVLRSTAAALRTASSTYYPVAAVLEVQPFSLSIASPRFL